MPRYVAFLRAINVGGHTVTNDQLRTLFGALDVVAPTPYQASGNVVFGSDATDAPALEERIGAHLEGELGYGVGTFLRTIDAVVELAAARPFGELPDGAKLHIAFLRRPPTGGELTELETLATPADRFVAQDRQLLWQVDGPFRESLLASPRFERALAQPTTVRGRPTLARIAARFGS